MRFAIGHADQHEPAAPNISRGRVNDRQRESRGDGRIDGIASGLQDVNPDLRSKLMHSDYHRMLGMDWVRGCRADRDREQKQSGCEQRIY
jgi:hypothetical protein